MKKIVYRAVAGAVALLFMVPMMVSCESGSDELSAAIELSPMRIFEDGENEKDTVLAENAVLHIFYADTASWRVASYEDAVTGLLRARDGSGTISPEFTATVQVSTPEGEQQSRNIIATGPVTQEVAVAVVYDPDSKMYGWREIMIAGGLEKLVLWVYFDSTRQDDYADTRYKWQMHAAPAPAPPVEPE